MKAADKTDRELLESVHFILSHIWALFGGLLIGFAIYVVGSLLYAVVRS